jgi:phenylalanyl-tRNA synthetase beta chain
VKISLNWLKDFVDFSVTPEQMVSDLSMLGLETEKVEHKRRNLEGVVAARVSSVQPVPDSDHLSLCQVDTGREELQVICGAPNVRSGQTVCLATVGTVLPNGMKIRQARIRGVESFGMLCSDRELELSDAHEGIRELEDVALGTPLAELWNYEDTVLDLEVTQNRGDCLSIYGIARELSALYRLPLQLQDAALDESGEPAAADIRVELPSGLSCKRYTARVVRNVEVKPSPQWLIDRLEAVGIRAINNVVDITNYVMWQTGHPLHAFDLRNIKGKTIKVRNAQRDEIFRTLDGVDRKLTEETLLICDAQRAVAIGGIMGGENSGIADDTTDVLLECAWFDPINIRMSARRLGLMTDSSRRFERGVDPNDNEYVIDLAARLLQDLASGKVAPGRVDAYPEPITAPDITLRPERVNRILGMELPAEEQRSILERLQIRVEERDGKFVAIPPTFRSDLTREIDLIEEIIRLHGYDRVPTGSRSLIPLTGTENTFQQLRERLETLLTRSGCREISTYSMISRKAQQAVDPVLNPVTIVNPISDDLAVLRTSMLPSLLQSVAYNLNHYNRSVALFETGRIFLPDPESYNGTREKRVLAVALSGIRLAKSWDTRETPFDFFDLKGLAEMLLAQFQLPKAEEPEAAPENLFTTNSTALKLGETPAAVYGELQPRLLEEFHLDQPVYYLELQLDDLLDHFRLRTTITEISRFPDNQRDLTFVVGPGVSVGQLAEVIRKNGGKHLNSVEFIALYTGAGIPEGHRSLTFKLRFNSLRESLPDKKVDGQIDRIIKAVENTLEGKLR